MSQMWYYIYITIMSHTYIYISYQLAITLSCFGFTSHVFWTPTSACNDMCMCDRLIPYNANDLPTHSPYICIIIYTPRAKVAYLNCPDWDLSTWPETLEAFLVVEAEEKRLKAEARAARRAARQGRPGDPRFMEHEMEERERKRQRDAEEEAKQLEQAAEEEAGSEKVEGVEEASEGDVSGVHVTGGSVDNNDEGSTRDTEQQGEQVEVTLD